MKALIQNGVVVDVRTDSDPNASEQHADVPHYVRPGHRFIDGVWCRADGTPLTADEKRWKIHRRTLVNRLTDAQVSAVAAALTAGNLGVWRLFLNLCTADAVLSDGIGHAGLAALFGDAERDRLLAPDPTFQE